MDKLEKEAILEQYLGGLSEADVTHLEDSELEVALFVNSGEARPGGKSSSQFDIPVLNGVFAIRRVNPFWYTPAMGDSLKAIPEDPEHSFVEHKEGMEKDLAEIHFLLWRREDGKHGVMVPLSNGDRRSYLRRSGDRLEQVVRFDVNASGTRPSLFVGIGDDPYQLVEYAARFISAEIPGFRLRTEKRLPDFVDRFGWCTWDAFYQEVSAEKVESGLQAFADGGVELGFLMIDDGWQQLEGFRFKDFDTDKTKFPDGLKPVVQLAKEKYGVGMVGVWHALQGYWHGVVASGGVAERFEVVDQESPSAYFDGWGEQFAPMSRGFVHPSDIHRWYQEFYEYLSSEGIDMVKVDNQGMLEFFTEGSSVGNTAAMKAYQQALQGASQTHFEGNLINCMSNTNDVAFNLSASATWRNSDDFYPDKPSSQQADHIVINAYNNVWTSTFVWGDWDMFQSTHKHAEFHAMGRAVSGSPVYVSDKVGAHDFDIIRKISLSGGRALRFEDPARPSIDSLFVDPRSEDSLLKVCNTNSGIGTVALFNCHSDDEGEETYSSKEISGDVSSDDLYQLDGDAYAFYAHKGGYLGERESGEPVSISLKAMESEIVTISPIKNGAAPLGLKGKYASSAAISSYEWLSKDWLRICLKDGGDLLLMSERAPSKVLCNEEVLEWTQVNAVLETAVPGQGVSVIDVCF
ncbi:Sip1-related alpha-galactosidase [Pelagicoccus mobilis]|uniref:Raffinose synthase n=1 Tax=Pelagicoccus mobilis TaxID=415221 RepID=A0A934S4A5_9BACT|nr:Sip1-related alpha-galactosidase [Pelagicoccus mobilis]MBK1880471.1 hypothetical protein [Pelagicoccus mobilis]